MVAQPLPHADNFNYQQEVAEPMAGTGVVRGVEQRPDGVTLMLEYPIGTRALRLSATPDPAAALEDARAVGRPVALRIVLATAGTRCLLQGISPAGPVLRDVELGSALALVRHVHRAVLTTG